MKIVKLFVFCIFLIQTGNLYAQSVSINNDGSSPNQSAILDLKSSDKGLLLPRLTNSQRDAISSPAAGLIIFNTDINKFQGFDGIHWTTIAVESCIPAQPGVISGILYPECGEIGVSYSISPVENATSYFWTVPSGSVVAGGQGTPNISVDFGSQSGNVSVRAESGCGNSTFQDLGVTIEIPEAPDPITGNIYPDCGSVGEIYSISTVNGARNYHWTVPADAIITSGQGTTSITVDIGSTSGNVSARSENSCGNSAYTDLAITVEIPDAPLSISGDTSPLCSESNVSYSIAQVNGATSYTWTAPSGATITAGQGTTDVTVDFGTASGNVSVRSNNSCGSSVYTDLYVTVGVLTQPGSITGNDYVDCSATGETYSVAVIPDATSYTWTVPSGATVTAGQGTTNITVDFGTASGNVSVRAENACTNTAYTDLYVSTIPEQPGSITGDIQICRNESGVIYSINPVDYATSYNWMVPADATITNGQGTTSITVDFGVQTGNVSVRAENACGNSAYSDLAVDVGIHVGCYYAGGVVFYVDGTGEHGLVCAVSDQSSGTDWGCNGTHIGAERYGIGDGEQNTIDIDAVCTTSGIAADICANLTLNGYSDWFLPSRDELNEMYINRNEINTTALNNGGTSFVSAAYWSSSEKKNYMFGDYNALNQSFSSGSISEVSKTTNSRVRAVRSF